MYLRWSAILIPPCASPSLAFCMMYSAYELNKQGDNIQPLHTPFLILNQSVVLCLVLTVASWPAYRFLRSQVRYSGIPISLRIFHCLLWSTWSNYCIIALISHTSKIMLKILQASLQQYVNCELPDVQAGFRKGRGTRDQIANICWIIEKARKFQKNIYFHFIGYAKDFDWMDHNKLENSSRDGNTRPPHLPPKKSACRSRSNS